MTRNYDVNTTQTLEIIHQLQDRGIRKIAALIRHSDRFYSTDPGMEPFMGLTENGKGYAFEFGSQMREQSRPVLYSSLMARCVETAYLIDKGFTTQHKAELPFNQLDKRLFAFYIKDFVKALGLLKEDGSHPFLRHWFNRELEPGIMTDPEKTTDTICGFMTECLEKMDGPSVAVCVSHDWNIYPVKEFRLDLPLETSGDVGYLDGVIFYEDQGQYWITSRQAKSPVAL